MTGAASQVRTHLRRCAAAFLCRALTVFLVQGVAHGGKRGHVFHDSQSAAAMGTDRSHAHSAAERAVAPGGPNQTDRDASCDSACGQACTSHVLLSETVLIRPQHADLFDWPLEPALSGILPSRILRPPRRTEV